MNTLNYIQPVSYLTTPCRDKYYIEEDQRQTFLIGAIPLCYINTVL